MNTATAEKVELRIPARAEFLSVARLTVAAIASRMDFDVDAIEDIKTGVGEACTNVIQHAGAGEAERAIQVICSLESAQLVVEVRDAGAGFDAERCGQLVDLEQLPPESLPDSGYGLLLIRALMDDFQCLSQPGAGTLVRMVKRCTRAA
jgi:serine/threonine-protein kinase RsbW